jgi:hypothetical protein
MASIDPNNPALAHLEGRELESTRKPFTNLRIENVICGVGNAPVDQELYCTFCGASLMDVPVGHSRMLPLYDKCDCSWRCCEYSKSSYHRAHLAYRNKGA